MFEWLIILLQDMFSGVIGQYIIIILLTFLPFLELRASIPYGVLYAGLPCINVFFVAVLSNIIIAPLLYLFLDKFVHLLFFIKPFEKWYHKKLEKVQSKIEPYVEKYGHYGLAFFIGVPLPGSGVYSGALAAYVLGFGYKKYLYSAVIGVLIAGIIVILLSCFADSGNMLVQQIFLKNVA